MLALVWASKVNIHEFLSRSFLHIQSESSGIGQGRGAKRVQKMASVVIIFCYFCLNRLKNPYDGPVTGMCILRVAMAQSTSHLTHRKFHHYTQLRPWQSKLFLNRFHSMPHTHHCWRGTRHIDEVKYVNLYSW